MNPGLISLLFLFTAILVGYLRKINIGVLSIGFSFLAGHFLLGMSPKDIVQGWPSNLFFLLLGVSFLFNIVSVNGTLSIIAYKITSIVSIKKFIPLIFFFMSMILAALGPGNIAICSLLLPVSMAISSEEKISPFLMATMVIAGSNAGGLSPIAPTGIIGITLADEAAGLQIGKHIFFKQIIAQSILALILYIMFKGYNLQGNHSKNRGPSDFNTSQKITLSVILLVVAGIIFGKWDTGLMAFLGASLLILLKVVDESKAIASINWSVLILVCGVGMLMNVCKISGGIDLLTSGFANIMNERTVAPAMAVSAGLMSVFSSASGVVMPTLIPTVPKLVATVGGDIKSVISSLILGAHLVTNSPFSTLGALAITSAGSSAVDKDKLFRQMLIFAIAGIFYGAFIVYIGIV